MTRFRFSLVALMATVFIAAGGFAVLANASPWWESLVFTSTLGALVVAILGSVILRGNVRSFVVGFAICGWAYLILVYGPMFREDIEESLLTTQLLDYIHDEVAKEVPAPQPFDPDFTMLVPDYKPFMRIGHSFWSWLLAVLGGLLARYFYATGESEREPTKRQNHDAPPGGTQ